MGIPTNNRESSAFGRKTLFMEEDITQPVKFVIKNILRIIISP
jgi:hypothetical protein